MVEVIFAIVFNGLIPVIVMAMLVRSLARAAPTEPNYRGMPVYNGLGIVWFVWLVSFWAGAHILSLNGMPQPVWVAYFIPLFPLIAGSCAFGLFDDWVGSHNTKGFKGHLTSFGRGVITTGGLKMAGIGFLSLFTSLSLFWTGIAALPRVVLATCAIALMANFMNLFDLRPGRANKAYVICLALALPGIAFGGIARIPAADVAAIVLAAIGPVVAVWRYDVGERGMIGDAGANSMGAFLGFIYATTLPLWALALVVLALFAANILSEIRSFSRIIESNRILRAFDMLGRREDRRRHPRDEHGGSHGSH
jgi:hypothetical protein